MGQHREEDHGVRRRGLQLWVQRESALLCPRQFWAAAPQLGRGPGISLPSAWKVEEEYCLLVPFSLQARQDLEEVSTVQTRSPGLGVRTPGL